MKQITSRLSGDNKQETVTLSPHYQTGICVLNNHSNITRNEWSG